MKLTRKQWEIVTITGFIGSFFPVYLFAFAETEIDSAIASILNATTPLMTLIFGVIFFGIILTKNKGLGVTLGLLGAVGLVVSGANVNPDQNYLYSGFVILAAACYAVNVNFIKMYMSDISALGIATGNFIVLLIPATVILYFSGFTISTAITNPEISLSIIYVLILGVVGTGIALIIFNKLIHISDPVFSSSVTYTIPIVGLAWGFWDGEIFSLLQLFSAFVILLGVLLVNKKKSSNRVKKEQVV
jgi:drug/metabolite transporter (DMT)-like permease